MTIKTFAKPFALAAACIVAVGCASTATADDHDHDHGESQMSAGQESLKRLMEGNARYVSGEGLRNDMSPEERAKLAQGQSPYAIIVSCADSRVPPELAFDAQPGELFVIRVAGNIVEDHAMASIEYAVAVLESPLVLVMGHESCGAVDAAVKAETENAEFPGAIQGLVEDIRPAVRDAMEHEGDVDLLEKSIAENVRLVVDFLENSGDIVGPAKDEGRLMIVPARYDLDTGEVTLVSMDDKHHEGHDHSDHDHGQGMMN